MSKVLGLVSVLLFFYYIGVEPQTTTTEESTVLRCYYCNSRDPGDLCAPTKTMGCNQRENATCAELTGLINKTQPILVRTCTDRTCEQIGEDNGIELVTCNVCKPKLCNNAIFTFPEPSSPTTVKPSNPDQPKTTPKPPTGPGK